MKKLLSVLVLFAMIGSAQAGGGTGSAGGDPVAADVTQQLNRIVERTGKMDLFEIVNALGGIMPKQIASYVSQIQIHTTDQPVKTPRGRNIILILDENARLSVQREAYTALNDQERLRTLYSMVLRGATGGLESLDRDLEIREINHRIFSEQPQK